jgi:hypothetical protein
VEDTENLPIAGPQFGHCVVTEISDPNICPV